MTAPAFTDDEKLRELEREIRMREHVWRNQLAAGDRTKTKQLQIMQAMAEDYRAKVAGARLL